MSRKDYRVIAHIIINYFYNRDIRDIKQIKGSELLSSAIKVLEKECENFNRSKFTKYIEENYHKGKEYE